MNKDNVAHIDHIEVRWVWSPAFQRKRICWASHWEDMHDAWKKNKVDRVVDRFCFNHIDYFIREDRS